METAGKQRRASGCAALRWLLAPGPLGRSQDHVILRRKREARSDAQVPCLHLPLRPPPPMLSPRRLGPYGRPEGGTGSSEKPNHPGGWQVAELGLEPETPAQGRPSHVLPRWGAGALGLCRGGVRGPASSPEPRQLAWPEDQRRDTRVHRLDPPPPVTAMSPGPHSSPQAQVMLWSGGRGWGRGMSGPRAYKAREITWSGPAEASGVSS